MDMETFDNLVPPRGDFRVVIGEFNRASITHDFDFLEKNDLWYLITRKMTDYDRFLLFYYFHPIHTEFTFYRNLKVLQFIHREGWTEFIIRALNINLNQFKK